MSWTWWMTLLVIFAALFLLGCIPVGIDASYGEDGIFLSAKIGFLKLQLLPAKPKKQKKRTRHRAQPAAKTPSVPPASAAPAPSAAASPPPSASAGAGTSPKKQPGAAVSPTAQRAEASKAVQKKPAFSIPGGLDGLLQLADLALAALGDLRRKLRVEELTLYLTFGSDDPADAALHYGQAWAAIGALQPAIDHLFVIKKRDIRPILDYNKDKMTVDAHLILTITVGRALSLALRFGVGFLKFYKKSKKAV